VEWRDHFGVWGWIKLGKELVSAMNTKHVPMGYRIRFLVCLLLVISPFMAVAQEVDLTPGAAPGALTALEATPGAQDLPRVGISVPVNATGEKQYQALAESIYNTVVLTLSLLGEYEVVELVRDIAQDEQALLERGLDENLANIVIGEVRFTDEAAGQLVLALAVFDTLEERVVLSREERPPSLLATFDATDVLVAELVQEFSGVPIGFGTLVFTNQGEQGSYRVYLDGTAVGVDIGTIESVLMGERRVEIRQTRMLGEQSLYAEALTVVADGRTEVQFEVPYLLDQEATVLNELESEITQEIEQPRSERTIEELFERAEQLLEREGYSPAPPVERLRFEQIRTVWMEDIDEWRLRLRPRWIFPVAVGWADRIHTGSEGSSLAEEDPLFALGFARRFGESWYLGLDGLVFMVTQGPFPFGPAPLPLVAYRMRERNIVLSVSGVALPTYYDDELELQMFAVKPGISINRISVYGYLQGNKVGTPEAGIAAGFFLGYVF